MVLPLVPPFLPLFLNLAFLFLPLLLQPTALIQKSLLKSNLWTLGFRTAPAALVVILEYLADKY